MNRSITCIDLPVRTINALVRAQILTVGELLALSDFQISKLNGMGPNSLKTIKESIHKLGYKSFDEVPQFEQKTRLENAQNIKEYRRKENVLNKLKHTREDLSPNAKTFQFKFSDSAQVLTDEPLIQEFFEEFGISTINDLLKREPFYLYQSFLAKAQADSIADSSSGMIWSDLIDNMRFFKLRFDNNLSEEELKERNLKREDPNAYINDKINILIYPRFNEKEIIEPQIIEPSEKLKSENDNLVAINDNLAQANEELKNEIKRKKELLKQYKELLEESERLKQEDQQLEQEIGSIATLKKYCKIKK